MISAKKGCNALGFRPSAGLHFAIISYKVFSNLPSTWQKDLASTKGHVSRIER